MKHTWLVLIGVGLVLATACPARADDEAKDISRRIQALRERLDQFRSGKTPPSPGLSATGAPVTPLPAPPTESSPAAVAPASTEPPPDLAVESEALEQRQDVKVLILFHDGSSSTGPIGNTSPTAAPASPAACQTPAPEPVGSAAPAGESSGRSRSPSAAPAGMQRPALVPTRDGFPSPTSLKKSWLEKARRRVAQRLTAPTL